MGQLSNTFETYDATGNREDLANVIYNISPTDTPFMSSAGTGTASFTKHEWQTDSLAAAAANLVIEGDDSPNRALTATTRLLNHTQISTKPVVVTGTQEVVNKAGVSMNLIIVLYNDLELIGSNKKPLNPSETTSLQPGTLLTNIGLPIADASKRDLDIPSR